MKQYNISLSEDTVKGLFLDGIEGVMKDLNLQSQRNTERITPKTAQQLQWLRKRKGRNNKRGELATGVPGARGTGSKASVGAPDKKTRPHIHCATG